MSNEDGFNAVAELAVNVAQHVETELEKQLEEGGYVTKMSLTKIVAEATGENPGFVTSVLNAYLTGRDDLEVKAGRAGGVYRKDGKRPFTAEEQMINGAAEAILATKSDEEQLTTQQLADRVSQSTGVAANKTLHTVRRYVNASAEWELVKRVGIRRVKNAAVESAPVVDEAAATA
jgi:hypothetical protein